MKLALILGFCLALASARLQRFDDLSLLDDLESGPTTCQVSSRKVKTFENARLLISLPNCYTVLSKDCSSDPKYVVLMRKLSPNSELKEIKILTRSHKIVLTPCEETGRIRLIVNGEERPLNEELELTVRGYPVIRITKEGQQQVKVQSLIQRGLKLRFDGHVCDIKLPELSFNKQCGLCGVSNLELKRGYRTSELLSTPNVRQLLLKHITSDCRGDLVSDECDSCNCQRNSDSCQYKRSSKLFCPECDDEVCNEINCPSKQCSNLFSDDDDLFKQSPRQSHRLLSDDLIQESRRLFSDEIFGDETDEILTGKRPQLKHKVVEREDKVCVSLVRVPQCPVNTFPQQKIEKRIPYHCVYRNDPRVWKFETRIRNGERIPEIQRLTPSLTRTEVIPVKCSSFY